MESLSGVLGEKGGGIHWASGYGFSGELDMRCEGKRIVHTFLTTVHLPSTSVSVCSFLENSTHFHCQLPQLWPPISKGQCCFYFPWIYSLN